MAQQDTTKKKKPPIETSEWGGHLTIQGGVTARPRFQAIAGLTVAGRYQDFELSVTTLPTVSGGSDWFIQHFDLMGAYRIRLWENKVLIRPKIGAWNMWNGKEAVKWNETDIVYGLAIDRWLYDNMYFTVQGLDVSSNGRKSTRHMNTRKLLTVGWTLKF